MTREEALDKARKLLRLGESDNEHEAALAMAQAQRILERFEMELADLRVEVEAEPLGEHEVRTGRPGVRRMEHWRLQLCSALARANGVSLFYSGARITLCGRRSDTARVALLYGECSSEIQRLAATHARGRGRSYANAYRMGAVDAVRRAIQAEREALRAEMQGRVSERALVVVDTRRGEASRWMYQQHANLRAGGYSGSIGDASGWSAGRSAGAGVYGRASRSRLGGGPSGLLR